MGEFHKDVLSGQGQMITPEGKVVSGEFENGVLKGKKQRGENFEFAIIYKVIFLLSLLVNIILSIQLIRRKNADKAIK